MARKETLGQRLRAARLDAGFSQAELAERCGMPKPTLSRYENDHVSPALTTLRRIAQGLGLHLTDLLPSSDLGEQRLSLALRARGITVRSEADAEQLADLIQDFRMDGARRRYR